MRLFRVGILCLAPACLHANPTGGSVASGAATITGQGTSAVTIKQASNLTVINWQTFSINSGQTTSFIQPSATSAALNRVLGGQTSLINGTLSANGQVYLINGNGVIVGPGGVINANAFTASTRDISDADFLSGNLHFAGSSDAGVQNLGTINAIGGNVVLIGKTVDNEGTITAPKGTAGLIAGDDVLLAQQNADGSTITVSPSATASPATTQVGVKNGGAITAAAAELKAANGNIYALAVQNQGTIRATTVRHQGGRIWLTSDSGTVSDSGTLNASATAEGGRGGSVTLKSTTGKASHTGQIIAQGGAGGVGGSVDISGAQLQFTGKVDLTAFKGTTGNLLLDPNDIDILTGGGSDLSASTIDPSAIVSALNTADVTLSATFTITVDNAIDASTNTNSGNLILNTVELELNAPIVLKGSLSGAASQALVGANGLVQNAFDGVQSGGSVVLAPGATYDLTTQLLVNKDLNVDGQGATLNGQGSTRIMEINSGTVGISNTVFAGGNGAGSTGLSGSGNSGNGGAMMVYTQGGSVNLSLFRDTFVGNASSQFGSGGAIFNNSISSGGNSVLIENCTFTGNSSILGSVLYAYAAFGGTATFNLKSDTIAENSGTGAIYSTVLSSGNATVSVNDTILAGNVAYNGESDFDNGGGGALVDGGYNLYGQNGNAGGFVPGAMGDILLTGPISNEVGPLILFGPGLTPTMPLLATSLSLESGDPAFNGSTDQNGVTRGDGSSFTGSNSDIGAFEAQYVSIQANSNETLYGTTPVFSYTVVSGPSTAEVVGTPALVTPQTNAGFYGEDIGQGTVTATPGLVIDFTNADLTIDQRPVTVLPDSGQSKIYGTADPILTYTTSPANAVSGLVNGDTLTGSPSYLGTGVTTSVGNYTTTLGTLANGNYTISLSSAAPTFAVTPRTVVIDPQTGQGKLYGTPDQGVGYNTEPADATTGLVNGDGLAGALSYNGAALYANAGTYTINTGTVANSNYVVTISPAAPAYTVFPREVFVTVDAGQGKVYGATDPTLTYTTTPADASFGLVNGDTLSGSPSYIGAGTYANVGTYQTLAGTLNNPNYVIAQTAPMATFVITARPVTVLPDAGQSKTYGDPDPALSYTTTPADTTSGLVNGDTLTGSPSYDGAGPTANAGTYPTNLGNLANSNYMIDISAVAPTFVVNQRSVVITPTVGQSKIYGQPNPVLTYGETGLVNGDTLTGTPLYEGEGEVMNVGTYQTNLGTLADSTGNYVVTLDESAPTFAITPAPLVYIATPVAVPAGTDFPTFTGTVVGFVGSDTQDSATSGTAVFTAPLATRNSPAGFYEIDGAGLTDLTGNYMFVQGPGNFNALALGVPLSDRNQPPGTVTPYSPASTQAAAAQPNTPTSRAIAQNSTATINADPTSGNGNGNGAGDAGGDGDGGGGGGRSAGSPETAGLVDTNSNAISPNESMDTGPGSGSGGGDESSSGTSGGGNVASGSSFDPSANGATVVAVGQTVTVGGANNVPPPPIVQQQLAQILGLGAQDTLSTALSSVSMTTDDQGTTPVAAAAGTSGATAPGQTTSVAAAEVPNPGGRGNPAGPGQTGPVTTVAPGQTISLAGGRESSVPPPPMVRTEFDQGFAPQTEATLASAEYSGSASTTPATSHSTGVAAGGASAHTSAPAPLTAAATVVAPGQTVSLSGGKAVNIPPPPVIQTQLDQGFSPETRDTLAQAMGQ